MRLFTKSNIRIFLNTKATGSFLWWHQLWLLIEMPDNQIEFVNFMKAIKGFPDITCKGIIVCEYDRSPVAIIGYIEFHRNKK